MLVSLSSKYKKMMTWQKALMMIVFADNPSIDLFDRQKPMSFLKASISKTEWSSDTTNVRNKKYGFPSRKTRFSSSISWMAFAASW